MPRPRWPHLLREVSRHGTVRWVVRKGHGPRIAMPSEYGTPEFEAAYHAAVSGQTAAPKETHAEEPVSSLFDGRVAPYERRAVIKRIKPSRGMAILSLIPSEILEKEKNCGTFVYFLLVGDRMKIGMSRNVRKRASDIQTGQSERVEVAYSVRGGRALESYFHKRFGTERLHGEWFRYRGVLKSFLDGLPYEESEDAIIL
jgi:hypothetical protein